MHSAHWSHVAGRAEITRYGAKDFGVPGSQSIAADFEYGPFYYGAAATRINPQMIVRRFLVLVALAAFVAAPGCSGKREQAEESREMQTGEAQRSESPEPAGGGAAAEDSAESAAELFSRIHDHESKLSQTITSNRLDEAGREAFLIRDLIVIAAGQANVPVNQKAALEQHVSTVRRVATDLSEAGKAGNLNEVKARNAEFQRELGIIERMIGQVGGSSPGTK